MDKIIIILCIVQFTRVSSKNQTFYSYNFTVSPRSKTFDSHYKLEFESINKVCFGSPSQCSTFLFNPSSGIFQIFANHRSFNESKEYNLTKSKTIDSKKVLTYRLSSGNYEETTIYNDNVKYETLNTKMYFSYALNPMNDHTKPEIGLLQKNKNTPYVSFVEQLHSNELLNDFIIILMLLPNNYGRVYFGRNETLLSYLNKISFIEIQLKEDSTILYTQNLNELYTHHDLGNSTTIITKPEIKCTFDLSIGFIQIHKAYQKILSLMFNQQAISYFIYSSMKLERNSQDNYTAIFIDKNNYKKITILQELNFVFNENRLVLKKKDTFINYNDSFMIMAIIFLDSKEETLPWIIGEPILKYYIIEQDLRTNILRLYHKDELNISSKIIILFIVLCSFSILAIIVLIIQTIRTQQIKAQHVKSDSVENIKDTSQQTKTNNSYLPSLAISGIIGQVKSVELSSEVNVNQLDTIHLSSEENLDPNQIIEI